MSTAVAVTLAAVAFLTWLAALIACLLRRTWELFCACNAATGVMFLSADFLTGRWGWGISTLTLTLANLWLWRYWRRRTARDRCEPKAARS